MIEAISTFVFLAAICGLVLYHMYCIQDTHEAIKRMEREIYRLRRGLGNLTNEVKKQR